MVTKKKLVRKKAAKKKVVRKPRTARKAVVKKKDEYGLTAIDREFSDLYRGGPDELRGNAKRCYMKLHPRCKERSAEVESSKLLRKPEIEAYFKVKSEEVAVKCDMNAQKLLQMMVDAATADIADIYEDDGRLKPVKEWPMAFRQGLVAGFDIQEIGNEDMGLGTLKKVKLETRTKYMDMIGKHTDVQAFKEAETQSGVVINIIGKDALL